MTTVARPAGTHSAARVASLDGLRAISVSLVYLSHLGSNSDFVAAAGLIGVRIFFVISGFIITKLLIDERATTGRVSLKAFYLRRTYRIFPACYAYVAFILVLAGAGLARDVRPSDIVHGLTYTTNYAFHGNWSMAHLWSLAVEEQFYLLWPCLFVFLPRARARHVLIAVIVLAPFSRAITDLYARESAQADHMFHVVADSLAAGCLLAMTIDRLRESPMIRRIPSAAIYLWLTADILLSMAYQQTYRPVYQVVGVSIMNLSIALFILRAVEAKDLVTRVLNSKPLVTVGLLSYSMYLWQQPFLYPFAHPHLVQRFPINLAVTLLMAIASYNLVEKPVRRWGTARTRRSVIRPTPAVPVIPLAGGSVQRGMPSPVLKVDS